MADPYVSYQGGANQLGGLTFQPINPGTYWSTTPLNILPYYKPAWSSIGEGLAAGLGMGESIMKIPAEQAQLKTAQAQAQAQLALTPSEQAAEQARLTAATAQSKAQTALTPAQQAAEEARLETAKAESEASGSLVPQKTAATSAGYVTGTSSAVSEAREKAAEAKLKELQTVTPYDWFKDGNSAADAGDAFTNPLVKGVISAGNNAKGLNGGGVLPSPQVAADLKARAQETNAGTPNTAGNTMGEVKPGSEAGGGTNPALVSPFAIGAGALAAGASAVPGRSPLSPPSPTPSTGVHPAVQNEVINNPGKPDPASGQMNTHGVLPPDEVKKWYKSNYDSSAKSVTWSPGTQTYTIETAKGQAHVSPQQIFQNLGHYTPPSTFTSEVDAFTKNYALHSMADRVGQTLVSGGANAENVAAGRPQVPVNIGLPSPTPGGTPNAQAAPTPTPLPSPTPGPGRTAQRSATNAGANPDSNYRIMPDGMTWDSKDGDYVDPDGRYGLSPGTHFHGFASGGVFNAYVKGMPPGTPPMKIAYNKGIQTENQDAMLLKPSKDGDPAWSPQEIAEARSTAEGQARIQNEIARRTMQEASEPTPKEWDQDLNSGKQLIENGKLVLNALDNMKAGSADYNWFRSAMQDFGDKFFTTPGLHELITSVNKKMGLDPNTPITPAVSQLRSAFAKYVNSLPHTMFGRVTETELALMHKIIGDPSDNNYSFADNFGNDLVQRQEGYVDRVNQGLANRYRIGDNYLKFAEHQREDPILQHYVNAVNAQPGREANWPIYKKGQPTPAGAPTPGPLPSPRATPRASAAPSPTPAGQTTVQSNQGGQNLQVVKGGNDPVYQNMSAGTPYMLNGRKYVKGTPGPVQ